MMLFHCDILFVRKRRWLWLYEHVCTYFSWTDNADLLCYLHFAFLSKYSLFLTGVHSCASFMIYVCLVQPCAFHPEVANWWIWRKVTERKWISFVQRSTRFTTEVFPCQKCGTGPIAILDKVPVVSCRYGQRSGHCLRFRWGPVFWFIPSCVSIFWVPFRQWQFWACNPRHQCDLRRTEPSKFLVYCAFFQKFSFFVDCVLRLLNSGRICEGSTNNAERTNQKHGIFLSLIREGKVYPLELHKKREKKKRKKLRV